MSVYSLIGKIRLTKLPEMKKLKDEELIKITPLNFQDPALETVFRLIQKTDESIFCHSFINA